MAFRSAQMTIALKTQQSPKAGLIPAANLAMADVNRVQGHLLKGLTAMMGSAIGHQLSCMGLRVYC